MTVILTRLVWETLRVTPNLSISHSYSLILLAVLIFITVENGFLDAASKKTDVVKPVFGIFIGPILITFIFVFISRFIPLLF